MRTLLIALAIAAAGCCRGGNRVETETCTAQDTGTDGDCTCGLLCMAPDICSGGHGPCTGLCVRRCGSDADCGAGKKCTGGISPENGGGKYCQ
jgi:hypothetical protein